MVQLFYTFQILSDQMDQILDIEGFVMLKDVYLPISKVFVDLSVHHVLLHSLTIMSNCL